MFKWFNHKILIKHAIFTIYISIICKLIPVQPKRVYHGPWCGFFCLWRTFKLRKHLFAWDLSRTWYTAWWSQETGCDGDLGLIWLVEWWKTVSGWWYWYWMKNIGNWWCRDVVGYDFDGCGRSSISSWLIDAQPL